MPTSDDFKPAHQEEYQAVIARLREARMHLGLSQEEVANRLGRSQSFVSRCESGERRIDIIELKAFAELYERSVLFFLYGYGTAVS